jgi:hypothetical protein
MTNMKLLTLQVFFKMYILFFFLSLDTAGEKKTTNKNISQIVIHCNMEFLLLYKKIFI